MPVSQRLYRWLGITLLSGALALLLLLSVVSVWLVGQNRLFADGVSHTEEVLNRISRLHTEIRTIESSQRGFLLTQDAAYLGAYELTRLEIDPSIDKLRALVDGDPIETARVDQIKRLADEKLRELARTVADERAGKLEQSLQLLRSGEGYALMKSLDTLFNSMTATESQALAGRARDYNLTSGTAKWLNIFGTVATAGLAVGFWIMTGRYLLALREAQQELSDANTNLEQRVQERTAALQRANEEVQRFAYIVSHDLRSPLVNIMGFTSELEAARATVMGKLATAGEDGRFQVDDELRLVVEQELPEAIGFIRTSAQKMDRLIKAILQISREGTRRIAPEPIELTEIVGAIRDSLRTMLEARGAEIVIERLPSIVSDRLTIEQILSNLLENAVKYLSPQRPGRIVVTGRTSGSLVEISVADNGRGIDTRDMERIFELFRRAGPQDQPGEGIGLANVRAQATRLGGAVTCVSELGVGSTFTLVIPRVLAHKAEKEAA